MINRNLIKMVVLFVFLTLAMPIKIVVGAGGEPTSADIIAASQGKLKELSRVMSPKEFQTYFKKTFKGVPIEIVEAVDRETDCTDLDNDELWEPCEDLQLVTEETLEVIAASELAASQESLAASKESLAASVERGRVLDAENAAQTGRIAEQEKTIAGQEAILAAWKEEGLIADADDKDKNKINREVNETKSKE